MTPPQFSVFEYLEQYLTCFKGGLFRQMWSGGNVLQVWDRLGEGRDTSVAVLARHWNSWACLDPLICHRVGNETDFPFVRGREIFE